MNSLISDLISTQDIANIAILEDLALDDEKRIGILKATESIDVQACPGSGKTTLVAVKLMLLAKNWPFNSQGICVLSHTNVAKDQIIQRLKNSKIKNSQNLLTYPHFIGTIQEFVDRFLALPYLRSNGIIDIRVDNDEYVKVANRLLDRGEFTWLRGTLKGLGKPEFIDSFLRGTFRICTNGETDINFNREPKSWKNKDNSERAKHGINKLKQYIDKRGIFLYRDMYTHASMLLNLCKLIPKIISSRFPCVFIDEMQDTQEFQDEILQKIFPINGSNVCVQRFGDPDQSIFIGIGSEIPNKSYNNKSAKEMDFVINKSHRFTNGIAKKIINFSYNKIPLESNISKENLEKRQKICTKSTEFTNTIIVFDDSNIKKVIPTFLEIVSKQFTSDYIRSSNFTVKIVGAVGKEITPNSNQFRIGHYWQNYRKENTQKAFEEESLIEAINYCKRNTELNWSKNYKLLTNCIIKLLNYTNNIETQNKITSLSNFQEHMVKIGNWNGIRQLIFDWLNPATQLNRIQWDECVRKLIYLLEINNMSLEAQNYLEFSEPHVSISNGCKTEVFSNQDLVSSTENKIEHKLGFTAEISTIHSVKGETHDATLLLETKNYCFDLKEMLPFLTMERPSAENPNTVLADTPNRKRENKQFMRQLYVAMSRPRHVLCLAIHSDRISKENIETLTRIGWNVVNPSE